MPSRTSIRRPTHGQARPFDGLLAQQRIAAERPSPIRAYGSGSCRESLGGGSRARNVRHRPTAWQADGVAVPGRFCHFQAMSRKRATSDRPIRSRLSLRVRVMPRHRAMPDGRSGGRVETSGRCADRRLVDFGFRRGAPPRPSVCRQRGCIGAFRSEENADWWLNEGVQGEGPAGFVAAWSAETHPGGVRSRC